MSKKIIAFAGPSGVGKSTITQMLLHSYPQHFSFAVSATTRPMRFGEVNGTHYFFMNQETFKAKVDAGEFIEWTEVFPGRFYGTLKSEFHRIVTMDRIMILDIDVLGSLSIKKQFGEQSLIIFIQPESVDVLEERLRSLKNDSEQEIQMRVARFKEELFYQDKFDAIIVNTTGDIDGSRAQLQGILDTYLPEVTGQEEAIQQI